MHEYESFSLQNLLLDEYHPTVCMTLNISVSLIKIYYKKLFYFINFANGITPKLVFAE